MHFAGMGGSRARLASLRLTVPEALLSIGLVAWGVVEAVLLASTEPLMARVALALVATVPLAWRNRFPAAVMAWTLVVLAFQERVDLLPATAVTPYQCVPLATYALAASDHRGRLGGWVAGALVVVFPAFLLALDADGSYELVHAVATALVQLTIVIAGTMVRARRIEARRADALLQRESQSAPARLAAAIDEERAVIARELRAIVTSDLARIDQLLGQAADGLADGDGVRARRLAESVQATAARAVGEMRQMLVALAGSSDERDAAASGAPHPTGDGATRASRQQRARDRAADLAVLTPLAVLLVVEVGRLASQQVEAALAGVALLLAPAGLRRRWPLAAACALSAGLVLRELAGWLPPLPITLMPTLIVGGYAAAAFTVSSRRALAAVLALVAGGLALAALQLGQGGDWPDLAVVLFVIGCSFAAGQLVRDNDGRILTLRAGTAELAAEHRQRRAAAREAERRRAARELHDVVAHGVSLIAVQAGAAAATAERDPALAAQSTALAAEALRQTRRDLGRLADLLGVGMQAPPPRADDLVSLVESARRSGQDVELVVDGPIDAVPAEVGVSVYRIVQESLTNARKHAAGAATSITVRALPAAVELGVSTAPGGTGASVPGTGRGLAGMRERARLLGGELSAEPLAGGGFLVRARLPC